MACERRGREAVENLYRGQGGPLFLNAVAYGAAGGFGYIIGGFSNQAGAANSGKFFLNLRKAASWNWLILSDMDNGNRAPPQTAQPGRGSVADVGAVGR